MNGDQSIFPFPTWVQNKDTGTVFDLDDQNIGLTKREYVATHLLAGLLSNHQFADNSNARLVNAARTITDDLFEELKK